LYDENGYRVVIDPQGNHLRYDQNNNLMKLKDGVYQPYNKEGLLMKDGKLYD